MAASSVSCDDVDITEPSEFEGYEDYLGCYGSHQLRVWIERNKVTFSKPVLSYSSKIVRNKQRTMVHLNDPLELYFNEEDAVEAGFRRPIVHLLFQDGNARIRYIKRNRHEYFYRRSESYMLSCLQLDK